jgi:Outer membrane receptor proteins, mostly Fe transport
MRFPVILILTALLLSSINGFSQGVNSMKKFQLQQIRRSKSEYRNEIITAQEISANTQLPVRITGRVTDDEGNAIPGVSVFIKETKRGTSTDDNGNFSIEAGLGDILIFSSVSYETKEVKINQASLNIKLSLHIRPLEQLVVSGNLVAIKRKADVSSVTVLTAKDIEALPGFNLVNIVEGVVPGIAVTSAGTDVPLNFGEYFNSQISVRGAAKITAIGDASSTKVFVDGVVYPNGTDFLAMINKDNIDRIEFVRGPSAAALYGSGASGGVILIYTKTGKPNRKTFNVSTSAGFQKSSFTEKHKRFQQDHLAEYTQGFKNFSFEIGGNYKTQDDYLPKGSLKLGGGYTNFTYKPGKFNIALSSNYNVNTIINNRDPVFDTISRAGDFFSFYKDSSYFKTPVKIQSGSVSLNTTFQPTKWWTHNLVLGYSYNIYHSVPDISIYSNTALIKYYMSHGDAVTAQDYDSKNKSTTFSYNNVIKIGNTDEFKMTVLSGFEYSKTNHDVNIYNNFLYYTDSTGFTYFPNHVGSGSFFKFSREFTGAFLQVAPSLKDKYFIVGGFRYEKSNVSKAFLNPKIGFTTNFELSHFIIKPRINWGRGVTPPPYFITHPPPSSGNIIYLANPGIKPQDQSGIDAAMEVYDKKGNLRIEVIRYDNTIKNGFARLVKILGAQRTIKFINIGKFSNKGWEFSSEFKINNFKISGNYSIIKSTFIDSFVSRKAFYKGDRVDFTPDYAAGASVNYFIPNIFGKSDRLSVTLSMTSSGKMITFDSYQNSIDYARATQGYGSFPDDNDYYKESPAVTKYNLDVDYQFHPNLRFFILSQNFTNNTTPDWDKSYPVPGASWMFGLKLNYNKISKE